MSPTAVSALAPLDAPFGLLGDILQALLGTLFVIVGGTKLVGVDEQVESFERWGYPQWFRVVTGGIESAGGVALLAGVILTPLTVVGVALIGGTMLGAVYTHAVRVGDPVSETAKPVTLGLLVVVAVSLP